MNIKVSGFKSLLRHSEDFNEITKGYIKSIEKELGEKIETSDLADYDCDLKLIYIESGGSEGLFLANIDSLKEPYYFLTNGSNNSLAASLEIMTYLNLHNLKGEVLHGDVEYVAGRIKMLAGLERLTKALKNTTFGVLGKPSDWLISSIPSYENAKAKLGISFKDILLDEVEKEFAGLSNESLELLPQEFPAEERYKALRCYRAFKNIAEKYKLQGFTVRCFDLLNPLKTTGCVGLSLLNDLGITAACEGDIAALISMHIATVLTGEPTFQANPSRISVTDNTIVFAHCTIPLGMVESYRLDTHFESGTGIAVKGELKETDVTVLRISSDLKRFFVSDGRILKNLDEKDLCRTQILVKMEKDVSEILKNPCGNHHIIFYGHHAKELTDILNILLK